MSGIPAIVLRTAGTNCDQETAHALRLAGAEPQIVHINQLLSHQVEWSVAGYGGIFLPETTSSFS